MHAPRSSLGTTGSVGSVLKQRNPSGIRLPDTELFFTNIPFE